MIAAIIIFSIIVLIPYGLYFKKRYDLSKNKESFLNENLYQSTIWIVLLVIFPVIIVNLAFPDTTPNVEYKVENVTLEELKNDRDLLQDSLEFHKTYIEEYFEVVHSKTWDADIKMYYENLSRDEGLSKIGYWGLGYYYLKKEQNDSSIICLKNELEEALPYQNYLLAKAYKNIGDDSLYRMHLIKEAANPKGYKEEAFSALQQELIISEDLNLLTEVRSVEGAPQFIHPQVARKIYFNSFQFLNYYLVVWEWFIKDINLIGLIAAFLILSIWLVYLVKLAFFEKVNWPLLMSILTLGMITSFLTFLIGDVFHFVFNFWEGSDRGIRLFLYSVFGIGAVEEFVKILPLLFLLFFRKRKLQPYEYLLFGSVSALGFAFVENLIYFNGESYGTIIHGRALTSAVGHMVDSSIFAYGLMLARYKKNLHPAGYFIAFWFLASLCHGLYDYFLFTNLILFFMLFFFMIARIWNTLINNTLNNSENFKYTNNFKTKPIQFYMAFSLTAVLMFEYCVVGFLEGSDSANSQIIGTAFSGSFLIMFLGSKLTTIDLIKGYWSKVNISVNPFTDDVVSQNFIGEKVRLRSYYIDDGLANYYSEGVTGRIVNRVVLQTKPATFFLSHDDPNWFLVKLDQPLIDEQHKPDRILIKLKDPHSSLNISRALMISVLLIPKQIPKPKKMRKNFKSLGWAFLET